MSTYGTSGLATIGNEGQVPECRMRDPQQVQDFAKRLSDNDEKRSYKRGRLNGLVDGNPPYRRELLLKANRADACNVNWGTAKAYLDSASGAFYDLTAEAPGFVGIKQSHGTDEEREVWGRVMMEEADHTFVTDALWDYEMQQSQNNMTMHGTGPFLFDSPFSVFPKAFQAGDLKVPEFTKADTQYWEAATVQDTLYPPQLFKYIMDKEAARLLGWDVDHVVKVIENAMDLKTQPGIQYDWEYFQQEFKNNSLSYYDDSRVCRLVHVFWQEFDQRITHAIVERDTSDGTETKFLFMSVGRYKNWNEVIHPMYYDRGNGGYHHSVTGFGVKAFSAMEYENRLLCNGMDKSFAPKTLFKPTSTEATQRFQMANHGDYALLPPGYEIVQNPMSGMITDTLTIWKATSDLMKSNLSSYRQQVPMQESGNPPTKYQKQLEASQQSSLSKTTYNRYYKQLDALYAEIVNRLCNLNSTDQRALDFQKRCMDRGVPKECFGRVTRVEAVRVIGQGSAFMRKMAVDSLLPLAGSLPEEGRDNLISDKIAAEAGQSAVTRYYKKPTSQEMPNDQQAEALQWVAAMKVGVPPIVTSSQNPVTYAGTFLTAGVQAVQSLRQGAKLPDVLAFLELDGPAILAQLKRIANDTLRKPAFDAMLKQWKQLAAITDKLKKMNEQQNQQAMEQQQRTQQTMTEDQLKAFKVRSDIQLKQAKTAAQLKQSQEKHQMKMLQDGQNLVMADARTASEIHLNRLKAFSQQNGDSRED